MKLFDHRGRQIQSVEEGAPPIVRFGGASSLAVLPVGNNQTRGVSDAILAYRLNPNVWGLINKIATSVASVEWVALKRKQPTIEELEGARRPASKAAANRNGVITRNADELVESGDYTLVQENSLFLEAWQSGCEFVDGYLSAFDVRYTMVANYLLAGEVYLFQVANQANLPHSYMPFPSARVKRRKPNNGPTLWDASDGDTVLKGWKRNRVFRWRALDPQAPYSTVAGLGGALASEISADELAAQVIRGRFSNSGTPPGFIVVRGAGEDQIEELTSDYDKRNAASSVSKPMIVNDDISYVQVGESFGDLSIHEQRVHNRHTMRQAIGMPPEIMGDVDNSNRATISAADRFQAQKITVPILRHMADFLNREPRRAAGTEDYLSFVDPMPDDQETRLDLMKAVPEPFKINEIRRAAGVPDEPDGDVYYRDFNMPPQLDSDSDFDDETVDADSDDE